MLLVHLPDSLIWQVHASLNCYRCWLLIGSHLRPFWKTLFSQWEPPNLDMPGRWHLRPMINWFRGIKTQSPCLNAGQALWYKSYSIAPSWDQAEAISHLCLASSPALTCLLTSLQVSPKSTPSINNMWMNPHLRLCFWEAWIKIIILIPSSKGRKKSLSYS